MRNRFGLVEVRWKEDDVEGGGRGSHGHSRSPVSLVLFSEASHYQSQAAKLWSPVPADQPFSHSDLTMTLPLSVFTHGKTSPEG